MSETDMLSTIWGIIRDRENNPPPTSYVCDILNHRKGIDKALEKVGEESTEFILAMKNEVYERKVSEAADLIFHLLLALRAGNVELEDVLAELGARRK
jgi:phosphoribosyl-ATP pyrophosphohydrolase